MMNEINDGWEMGYGWIFIIVAAVVIVLLLKVMNQKRNHKRLNYKSSMEIRKERFAMGESRKDEYGEKEKTFNNF